MKNFILFCISRARVVLTILAAILIGGIVSMFTIPKQRDPDIPIPFVYVSVIYPGISPEDAERLITKPLEVELQQVEGWFKFMVSGRKIMAQCWLSLR